MCRVKKYLKTSAGKHLRAVRAMLGIVLFDIFINSIENSDNNLFKMLKINLEKGFLRA